MPRNHETSTSSTSPRISKRAQVADFENAEDKDEKEDDDTDTLANIYRCRRRKRRSGHQRGKDSQPKISDMFGKKRPHSPNDDKHGVSDQKKAKANEKEAVGVRADSDENCDVYEEAKIQDGTAKEKNRNGIFSPGKTESLKDDNESELETEKCNFLSKESLNNETKMDTDDNENTIMHDEIDIKPDLTELNDLIEKSNQKEELKPSVKEVQHSDIDLNNQRCSSCRQFINNSNIIYFQGHPQDSVEEYIALTNDKLVLSAGDEGDITERPQCNITGFSIFDKEGHMCQLDGGLIETDVRLYISGYLKTIWSESPDIDEDSIPAKDIGPIIEWQVDGPLNLHPCMAMVIRNS